MEEKYSDGTSYFENRSCKYYPCHEGSDHINCMFCFCPFYHRSDCPGAPQYIEKNGRRIKSCMGCRFPHEYDNIDKIMSRLKEENSPQQ